MKEQNITIYDNGAGFCVQVDGLIIKVCQSLGEAWRHIEWMHLVASQKFTVGKNKVPVEEWIGHMKIIGYLD